MYGWAYADKGALVGFSELLSKAETAGIAADLADVVAADVVLADVVLADVVPADVDTEAVVGVAAGCVVLDAGGVDGAALVDAAGAAGAAGVAGVAGVNEDVLGVVTVSVCLVLWLLRFSSSL